MQTVLSGVAQLSKDNRSTPLVSVIITCYNHAHYLPKAIESVLDQDVEDIEILVVDDGSVDDTKLVAEEYGVRYTYQQNQGLSAARNTGIENSFGDHLVFLDADDWLLSKALSTNLGYLQKNSNLAFVSGGHELYLEDLQEVHIVQKHVEANHYQHLLDMGNYIAMHATVMYRRWAFKSLRYDTSLRSCEDYDIYLKIARKHPILHHTELIASYRKHGLNMSGNIPRMLDTALHTLMRQEQLLLNDDEKRSYQQGFKFWKKYYSEVLYERMLYFPVTDPAVKKEQVATLMNNYPMFYFKYLLKKPIMPYKDLYKRLLPNFVLRGLYKAGVYKYYIPKQGRIAFGDLDRTKPFCTEFGFKRGGPVDRYYIENFLQENAKVISGSVLEIADNSYTVRFGGDKVSKSDVLHIDEKHKSATIIADLTNAPYIDDNTYDCIILTQTLQYIYEYKKALETCYRILKPGGTLLITVPGISQIEKGNWFKYWCWTFSENVMRKSLMEFFPKEAVKLQSHGNVFVATALLYGMGLPEVKKKKLDYQDPHYQVIITAKAVKPL